MMVTKEYQFKDIMDGFFDGPHATPEPSEDGPIFLGIKNIREEGGIDFSDIRHIAEQDYPLWTKRVTPRQGDIVFSYEATLHRYAIIPKGFRGCLGRRMALIRVNKTLVDETYLYHYFLSPYWKAFIETVKVAGSTVDRISISNFPSYKILLPHISVQQKIASILSAYAELIENNKKRIKLLEEMAEEIYKEWFVRFRFPGYESTRFFDEKGKEVAHGTPGALPEGWENGKLGDQVSIRKGQNITADTISDGNIPVVAGGLQPAYFHNASNANAPCITVSASGANAGFVNIYYQDIWASDCSVMDSNGTDTVYYFYLTLKTRQAEVTYLQKGSAQPHVYPKDLMGLSTKKPKADLVHRFESTTTPFFKEVAILNQKNQLLQQTRDLLLPRLISGKLSVEHLMELESLSLAAEPEPIYSK